MSACVIYLFNRFSFFRQPPVIGTFEENTSLRALLLPFATTKYEWIFHVQPQRDLRTILLARGALCVSPSATFLPSIITFNCNWPPLGQQPVRQLGVINLDRQMLVSSLGEVGMQTTKTAAAATAANVSHSPHPRLPVGLRVWFWRRPTMDLFTGNFHRHVTGIKVFPVIY